ncbi:response regulator transcription factor [Aureimonas sp. AU40]|uniref:response regulator transcription factor n=1 Tax=Aureimonas sp. AU40 TaxID=1637747 RepID=UPI000784A0D3|nr:response regulator transcription factor [Aureimonas sp. AU40]
MTGKSAGHEDSKAPVVYVVDDDPGIREALADLLASVDLSARTFGSTEDFLGNEKPNGPSCLVLDVRMPGQSGLEFHRRMGAHGLRMPVIFITGHGDIEMSVRAMKHGAIEFLTKPFRDQDLLDAIQDGLKRDRARLQVDGEFADLCRNWQSLSPGERQVMALVGQGLLNKQIAADLGLSEITVKVRRGHAMRKMQARSVVDLIRMLDRITQLGCD